MINIELRNNGFTITGHSGYAPQGADIVCASISTLAYTCINSIAELTKSKVLECTIDEDIPMIDITWEPLTQTGKVLLANFVIGVETVRDNYGDYVSVEGMT